MSFIANYTHSIYEITTDQRITQWRLLISVQLAKSVYPLNVVKAYNLWYRSGGDRRCVSLIFIMLQSVWEHMASTVSIPKYIFIYFPNCNRNGSHETVSQIITRVRSSPRHRLPRQMNEIFASRKRGTVFASNSTRRAEFGSA